MQPSAAIDTNVVTASYLSQYADGASREVFRSAFRTEFRLINSDETLSELNRVLKSPHFASRIAMSFAEIDDLCATLRDMSEMIIAPEIVSRAVVRDVTDAKFLDLALAADADYLVTNDRRHLLPLKKIGRTKIVTPHKFLLALKRSR